MSKFVQILCFLFVFLFLPQAYGQHVAFKTLLKSIYDSDFPLVYPDQVYLMENTVILDTREKEEYEISHLRESLWVGYDTFSLKTVNNIPKDLTVVVYCTVGARSQEIGKKLKDAGFENVFNLYGGIFHWVNEGKPVFKDGQETDQVHTYSRIWGIWLNRGEKNY